MHASDIITRLYTNGERPFAVHAQYTQRYADLTARISACLAHYDQAGLTTGDRVLIVTADERAAVAAFLAALLDGKVPAIIAPDAADTRQARLAAHFAPALTVADVRPEWASTLPTLEAARITPPPRRLFERPNTGRRPSGAVTPADTAYVLFTSGSTAEPKGVVISHGALAAQLDELITLFRYGPSARIFNGMALTHTDGLIQGPVLAAACGGAWLRPPAFTPAKIEDWLNLIAALNSTHFLSVPTVYAMIDRLAVHDDYFDLPDLWCLQSTAAKLPAALRRRIEARFGKPMANYYGLTETVSAALYHIPGNVACTGSGDAGRSLGVATRLVDADGQESETGELWLRGPQIFDGYWRAPDLTASVLQDGWLKTGDLARREADGSIEILGRIKAAINTGGLSVMPDEINEALATHPAVAEVATVGLADALFDEIVVCAVVLNTAVDPQALMDHCRERLEPLKVPKHIITVTAIPRGAAGKPQDLPLRALLTKQLTQTAPQAEGARATAEIIDLAAQVFRVAPETLCADSTPDSVGAWDSFTHLSLIMAAERRFGCRLDTAAIAGIQSLGDLARAIP